MKSSKMAKPNVETTAKSHCHLHLDCFVRFVAYNFKIIKLEAINVIVFLPILQLEFWERSWLSLQLLFQCIHVIQVDMCISNGMNEISSLSSGNFGNHVGQKCIRRNVERNTETHIRRTLVHLTGNLILRCIDVELAKHVTRWQRHQLQVSWVPSTHHNPPVLGVVDNLINAISQLIHTLSSIVSMHIFVLGTKMTPLESIHRSQITLFTMLQATRIKELA
mmetsp:Transcript_6937/g.11704  ORF Transcript_6937/g.11704 Transcript_6937/m.11704 type:complete len:221 (+) Transcript_6937:67-729(+)